MANTQDITKSPMGRSKRSTQPSLLSETTETGELPVHPLAAIFPMMSDDELRDLAADIKANGLVHPIILGDWTDADGQMRHGVVDGRNRLRACEIADVVPRFDELNGQDPRAYIVSVNLARRNLTKGQQAMALAMIYPEPQQGKRTDLSRDGTSHEVSKQRLSVARAVLRWAPDLANLVLAGTTPLDTAHLEAQRRQAAASSEETRMAQLQQAAPDIADLVAEERISLAAAMTELAEREAKKRSLIEGGRRSAAAIASTFSSHVIDIIGATQLGEENLLSEPTMKTIADSMELLQRLWGEINGEQRADMA